jgi:type IX secretion system PorP/SprF family membrane protein
MKRLYLLLLLVLLMESYDSTGQDIPLFSQKLTNSFMYNPAVAGLNVGSLTYSYRMSYGKVSGAPRTNFLSVHTPVAGHKIGVGLNYYQENVSFIKNNYLSAAFSYHIRLSKVNSLSFGVSGEYNFMGLNGDTNSDKTDPIYENLLNGNLNKVDFSFGTVFNGRYVRAGLAANRLATTWIEQDSSGSFAGLFSGFLQGMIPLRGGNDLLEPYIAFRNFSETYDAFDIGLYYTYDNKIMAGAALRKGSIVSVTAGFHLSPKLFLGATREMFYGEVKNQVGSANEITLRFDFNQYEYKSSFSNNYKSSMAYRRKSMSSKGSHSPAQMHRNQKKLSSYSPNKRYQNVKKLSIAPSQRSKAKKTKYTPPKKRKRKK